MGPRSHSSRSATSVEARGVHQSFAARVRHEPNYWRPAALTVLAAVWLTGNRAQGAEVQQAVRVAYTAPAGCSSRVVFVHELMSRTSRVRVVEDTEPAAIFAVDLADRGARVRGELRLIEPDGGETTRVVDGASCEEVVAALALIAAVLVDPESLTRATTPAPTAPMPPPSWRFAPGLAAGAALATAVGPGLAFGPWLELGLEVEQNGRRGPSVALAVEYLKNPTQTTAAGDADFSTTLGRLSVCPLRWPSTGPLFGSVCGAFEAGSVHAAGSHTLGEHRYSVLWLAVDPAVAFAYRPVSWLSAGFDGLLVFPLLRDSYYFGPNVPSYSVPAVGVTAQARLAATWP
jgi:hypothetical protein